MGSGNPYRARRWREAGSAGVYADIEHQWQQAPGGAERPAWLPDGASVPATLEAVGGDQGRAVEALEWELAQPVPRRTLVEPLQAIAG